jgi:hypothetical protein
MFGAVKPVEKQEDFTTVNTINLYKVLLSTYCMSKQLRTPI